MPIDQAVIDRFVDDDRTDAARIAARTAIELALESRARTVFLHAPLLAAYLDHLRRVRFGLEPKDLRGAASLLRGGFSPSTTSMLQDSQLP